MFPIIIGIYMFIGVLVPALVQSAMEFVKLVTSGLSHEAQCAFGLPLLLFVLLPVVFGLGFLMCPPEDPGTMARRGVEKCHIP